MWVIFLFKNSVLGIFVPIYVEQLPTKMINSKLLKQLYLTASISLAVSCKQEAVDPCSQDLAKDCDGMVTMDQPTFRPEISHYAIYDLTINPNNPDEIAFIGRPKGYEKEMLFVGSVSNYPSNRLQMLRLVFAIYLIGVATT